MTSTTTRSSGIILGVTSSVCFAASGPFAKALIDAGFSPLQAVWVRITGAAAILAVAAFLMRRGDLLRQLRAARTGVLVYGLAAVASCQALYFVAASRLPVGIAILLEFTGPVLVVGWVRLVRRQPVARVSAVGVLVAMLGLGCVVQIWSGITLDTVGLAAGLGAAAGNATFFILIDRLTGTIDALALTTGGMAVGALALLPLAAPWAAPWSLLGRSVALGTHAAPGWLLAGSLIVVSTVVSYVAGAAAIQRLSAPVAAGLAYVEPAVAGVIAWVALGERLGVAQILGGVVVLGGAYLAQRGVEARGADALAIVPGEGAAAVVGGSLGSAADASCAAALAADAHSAAAPAAVPSAEAPEPVAG